jgi:hypothetical protein
MQVTFVTPHGTQVPSISTLQLQKGFSWQTKGETAKSCLRWSLANDARPKTKGY